MSVVGYAPVSIAEGCQNLDRLPGALNATGCRRVFEDHASGATSDRPDLAACLDYSRVVSNVASIIALQTAALEEIYGVLRGLPASSRDDVLERLRDGRLQVRVVEGHVSHAKIFLLSDGTGGERCGLTCSANFSTSALLRDQHEVLIRFRDDRGWEHFERQYLDVCNHASTDVLIATLAEQQPDPDGRLPRDAASVLSPDRGRAGYSACASRRSSRHGRPRAAGGESLQRDAARTAEGGAAFRQLRSWPATLGRT